MGTFISVLSILLAVMAIGVAIVGVRLFIPISAMQVPGEWHTPVIVAVIGGTTLVSYGLFKLSDYLSWRLIATPEHQHVEGKWRPCMFCGAPLTPYEAVCRDCGSLVPTHRHPRSAQHIAIADKAPASPQHRAQEASAQGPQRSR